MSVEVKRGGIVSVAPPPAGAYTRDPVFGGLPVRPEDWVAEELPDCPPVQEARRSFGDLDCEWVYERGATGAPHRLVGLTVHRAGSRVLMTKMLLEHADPPHWAVADGVLTLWALNGTFRYRVGEEAPDAPGCVWLERLYFTPDEVASLAAWQAAGHVHPFTCPNDGEKLVPTERGWICGCCEYTQEWAHDFMKKGPPPHPADALREKE